MKVGTALAGRRAATGKPRRIAAAILCLGLALTCGGCIPAIVGGGAATVNAATQDRGLGGTISDAEIQTRINQLWLERDVDLITYLDITVDQGRVLLTGRARSEDMKAEAARLAWQASDVKEVFNEIQVDTTSGTGADITDRWITTRLRTAMITDGTVQQNNYSIAVVNGVVYLLGSARTRSELDRVLSLARNIPNVTRVVSYVRV